MRGCQRNPHRQQTGPVIRRRMPSGLHTRLYHWSAKRSNSKMATTYCITTFWIGWPPPPEPRPVPNVGRGFQQDREWRFSTPRRGAKPRPGDWRPHEPGLFVNRRLFPENHRGAQPQPYLARSRGTPDKSSQPGRGPLPETPILLLSGAIRGPFEPRPRPARYLLPSLAASLPMAPSRWDGAHPNAGMHGGPNQYRQPSWTPQTGPTSLHPGVPRLHTATPHWDPVPAVRCAQSARTRWRGFPQASPRRSNRPADGPEHPC